MLTPSLSCLMQLNLDFELVLPAADGAPGRQDTHQARRGEECKLL